MKLRRCWLPGSRNNSSSNGSIDTASSPLVSLLATVGSSGDILISAKQVNFHVLQSLDPVAQILHVKQYFSLHYMNESAKVVIAFVRMEGVALHWVQ